MNRQQRRAEEKRFNALLRKNPLKMSAAEIDELIICQRARVAEAKAAEVAERRAGLKVVRGKE